MTKVRDIMTRPVHSVTPRDTALTAAKKMREHDIGILPVIDEKNEIVGAVTDRDIVMRTVANGQDPIGTRINGIMSRNVKTCDVDQTVADAAQCMQSQQIRRMFVVDGDKKKLCGVVGFHDLIHEHAGSDIVLETMKHVTAA